MSFFDWFDLDPQKVVEFFAKMNINLSVTFVDRIITFLTLFALLVLFLKGINLLYKKWNTILTFFSKTRKWRQNYIKQGLEHSYSDYLQPEKQRCYVPTQCQGTPPHYFDEPDEAVAGSPGEGLVDFFINKVFTPNNKNRRLYCILAGSGMGKTTFAVQLFIEYLKKYKKSTLPYGIHLLDMGDVKILEEIKTLSAKIGNEAHQTILILDALDENLQASEDFGKFREELEEAIGPYKFVVITCRSQFFANEQEIPVSSKIRITNSEKNLLEYNKIYICPFSPSDINLYIKKKYPGWRKKNRQLRKRASQIIWKCSRLMARPVLLSYIDDLMDGNVVYNTETDLYELLIDKWLQREVNGIQDSEERVRCHEQLIAFSQKLATTMYQKWRETGDSRLDALQMKDFLEKNGFDTSKYQFRRRSLINHDSAGAYKFSHKSFWEFFLARHYFENSDFEFSFEGMDMAKLFFQGLCKREFINLRDKGTFVIKHLGDNPFLPHNEYTLSVIGKTNICYDHLSYVILPEKFSELELEWIAYDTNLQTFIEQSDIKTIKIKNYFTGKGSLRQVLKASNLKFMAIEGDSLPKTFIKDAEKKGIHVVYNGTTVVRGVRSMTQSTLDMQLILQKEKLNKLLQRQGFHVDNDVVKIISNLDFK